jgi:hypothetical protein
VPRDSARRDKSEVCLNWQTFLVLKDSVPNTPGKLLRKASAEIGIRFAFLRSMDARFRFGLILAGFAVAAGLASPVRADSILYGPSPYLQPADSPFNGLSFTYFHLETFEDGLLNTPGATASGGVVNPPNTFVDSVDGDDGVINGSGSLLGYSFYPISTSLTFTFDAAVLGSLPTHAGLVWTDIGYNSPTPYFGPVSFEAFGPLGASLGLIGPFALGDGMDQGQTAEDRFFGAFNTDGISAIRITTNTNDWEIDHLQYGAESVEQLTPVPEPSTLTLLGLGAVGLVRRIRSRRRS